MNPFEDDYFLSQLDFYGLGKPYEQDGLSVKMKSIEGRNDDYLNINMRFTKFNVPVMIFSGSIWMSITPMEVQSLYLAIKRSHGRVGTTGLGLGYFAMAAANKKEVESIDIYEIDSRVINFFTETFKDRQEFNKINIIHGDAHKNCRNKEYDYLFLDHYPTLCSDDMPIDLIGFRNQNQVESIDFWSWERVVFDAVHEFDYSRFIVNDDEYHYFRDFLTAEFDLMGEPQKYSSLYRQIIHGQEYMRDCLRAMYRWRPDLDRLMYNPLTTLGGNNDPVGTTGNLKV